MSETQELPTVPRYDERLHFRYFVISNRFVWSILALSLVLGLLWWYASGLTVSLGNSTSPSQPDGSEPVDEVGQRLTDAIGVIIAAIGDVLSRIFESFTGDVSIPIADIGFGLAVLVPIVLGLLTFRAWMTWRRSRLVVDETGVRLTEGDIPWLFVPGREQNLHPSIVNDLSKSRDIMDQIFFWNCWQASVLCDEQAGSNDEVQNVPVRGVDRLQTSVRALAAHHDMVVGRDERTATQLLEQIVEELKAQRTPREPEEQGDV